MSRGEKPIPFGVFVVIVGIVIAVLAIQDHFDPIQKKEAEQRKIKYANCKSKFNYDIDSIANSLSSYTYEISDSVLNAKVLYLDEIDGKYTVNYRRISPDEDSNPFVFSHELTAYKLEELSTIVVEKFEKKRTSDWGASAVEKEFAYLSFYDVKRKKLVRTIEVQGFGTPYVVERGRRAGAKTYFLGPREIFSEVFKLISIDSKTN
jgi:hypothetical protein